MMGKLVVSLLSFGVFAILGCSGGSSETAGPSRESSDLFSVVPSTVELVENVTFQLDEVFLEDSLVGETFQWESLDETVVTVDSQGLVHAVGVGDARIIVRVGDEVQDVLVSVRESVNKTKSSEGFDLLVNSVFADSGVIDLAQSVKPESSVRPVVVLQNDGKSGIVVSPPLSQSQVNASELNGLAESRLLQDILGDLCILDSDEVPIFFHNWINTSTSSNGTLGDFYNVFSLLDESIQSLMVGYGSVNSAFEFSELVLELGVNCLDTSKVFITPNSQVGFFSESFTFGFQGELLSGVSISADDVSWRIVPHPEDGPSTNVKELVDAFQVLSGGSLGEGDLSGVQVAPLRSGRYILEAVLTIDLNSSVIGTPEFDFAVVATASLLVEGGGSELL